MSVHLRQIAELTDCRRLGGWGCKAVLLRIADTMDGDVLFFRVEQEGGTPPGHVGSGGAQPRRRSRRVAWPLHRKRGRVVMGVSSGDTAPP